MMCNQCNPAWPLQPVTITLNNVENGLKELENAHQHIVENNMGHHDYEGESTYVELTCGHEQVLFMSDIEDLMNGESVDI